MPRGPADTGRLEPRPRGRVSVHAFLLKILPISVSVSASLGAACGAPDEGAERITPALRAGSEDATPSPSDDSSRRALAVADGDPPGPSAGSLDPPRPPAEEVPQAASPSVPPTPDPGELPEVELPEGVDAALLRLAAEHPDLELLCADRTCIQEADLDGDRKADVVLPVRATCDTDRCPTGVVVIPTRAPPIRIGAGAGTRLRQSDWELVDGEVVWESLGEAATPRTTRGLKVRATKRGLCARSMRLGRAILEFSGSDAAEALVFRKGRWEWVPCGF